MVPAREHGSPEAQFEVARWMQNGQQALVKNTEENAVVWYKKAAEQCDAEAQCALGECYYQARGVEKDAQRGPPVVRSAGDSGKCDRPSI
jgi:FOG: TPR repeat, SEL1 subfamily